MTGIIVSVPITGNTAASISNIASKAPAGRGVAFTLCITLTSCASHYRLNCEYEFQF